MMDSEKVFVPHLLSSFNFKIMQIVRVSVFFIPTPPPLPPTILSHLCNGAAWPYEMKYMKSYCYFGIYNSPAFMFGSFIYTITKVLFFTDEIPMK